MQKSSYWQDRFIKEEQRVNNDARAYIKQIEKQYDIALSNIEKDINNWYMRIAKNNQVSLLEAKRMLSAKELAEFKWGINEYIKAGETNSISLIWVKELENASARVHISRLEALKLQIQNEIESLYGTRDKQMQDYLVQTYGDTYYHTAYEIQKGIGLGSSVYSLDTNKVNQIIHKPWAVDGKNFSERIWEDKNKLINTLHNKLTQSFIRGSSPYQIVSDIAKEFNVKKSIAGRLVMTESSAYSSKAQERCYKDLGIDQYEIVATLDRNTSSICQEMDGKVFSMKEYEVGVTANPFHPNCRTVTAPYFANDTKSMRAMRNKDGKIEYISADMKYKEWFNKYVQDNEENDIIKVENEKIKSSMKTEDYNSYMKLVNENTNKNIKELYFYYSNDVSNVKKTLRGVYIPLKNEIEYSYPGQKFIDEGMSKYSTLAHEYGHFFDKKDFYDNLNYKEVDKLNERFNLGSVKIFKVEPSSSDEFLLAFQKDKELLKKKFMEWKVDINTTPGAGVQDALDGMFGTRDKRLTSWGHGDKYYNRKYNNYIKGLGLEKELKNIYQELGYQIKSQNDVKMMCRKYETASEAWANICSAVTCGGAELEYTQKYLPNMYEAFLKILKNVKKGA